MSERALLALEWLWIDSFQQIPVFTSTMTSALSVCGVDLRVEGRLLRVASLDGDKYIFLDDPPTVVEGLLSCRSGVDLFTFIQPASETTPKYSYPMEWDNFAALRITTFDDWWSHDLKPKRRNAARQAEKKGVTLRETQFDDALVEGIRRIYSESPIRQGKRFPHYGKSLEDVRCHAGTFLDRSVFIGAFFNETLIGFAKLTIDRTNDQAGLMHIISMLSHRDKAPTNALIAQAVRSCADRQIPILVYSKFAYGRKQSDSLSDFKRYMGFQRVNVPRYYVPLTAMGAFGFRMGLHRRLIDRLPEPFIAMLREVRAGVYRRRFQSNGVEG